MRIPAPKTGVPAIEDSTSLYGKRYVSVQKVRIRLEGRRLPLYKAQLRPHLDHLCQVLPLDRTQSRASRVDRGLGVAGCHFKSAPGDTQASYATAVESAMSTCTTSFLCRFPTLFVGISTCAVWCWRFATVRFVRNFLPLVTPLRARAYQKFERKITGRDPGHWRIDEQVYDSSQITTKRAAPLRQSSSSSALRSWKSSSHWCRRCSPAPDHSASTEGLKRTRIDLK
ncbi:hypothetical protein EVAR_54070_1 [Eumeta japonica]|uniref:Uncharacterized protein n=1 Tax=Eumeta variegata TaxID=151549 RepID=A0A4C1XIN2_EUMVA|nr:hypothetical protein EVAR_54070_1 [Eumeta japonica]